MSLLLSSDKGGLHTLPERSVSVSAVWCADDTVVRLPKGSDLTDLCSTLQGGGALVLHEPANHGRARGLPEGLP